MTATAGRKAVAGLGASVTLDDLDFDPYPHFARMRAEEPVCWFPGARRYLVTRYEDIGHVDHHPEIFSADEEGSLMTQIMGPTLLRKDGAEHDRERAAADPALRPRIVKEHWQPIFEQNADTLLAELAPRGEADLFTDFALPFAARNLVALLGLHNVTATELADWSQAMIDGGGANYVGDADVRRRALDAAGAVDAAVTDIASWHRENPNSSVLSQMVVNDPGLPIQQVANDIKVFIGGGVNEPRDALATAAWAVLDRPDLHARVKQDPALWPRVFEETVRWVSPIGMYPRQVVQETELGGVRLLPGDKLGICAGSANRDETVFPDPDRFDIDRRGARHVAFGTGAHYCLGTWAARSSVGQIALPRLFTRLPGLALDPRNPVRVRGWVFRGVVTLPAVWQS
ncbi:cytochrome P450 [Prescottella equi]|uniref:cytochrome P450 n=1 Tax=Rhodococcus hoagii TaxID=43767 RepID=UPI0007CD6742|nr:cytochrome P450 [Prescottella equi]